MELVLLVIVLVVAVGVVVWLMRSRSEEPAAAPAPAAASDDEVHTVREFHVRGDDALVYFDVPVPDSGVDDVFRNLLLKQAVEVLREKRSHHLPLEGVTTVRAYATSASGDVEVGSLDLDVPGELPEEIVIPGAAPHFSSAPFDPLAHLGEQEFKVEAGVAARTGSEDLLPLSEEISLTADLAAKLHGIGIDTATMNAGDLALGLLKVAGYSVGESQGGYLATGSGGTTFLQVVDHGAGDYPELEEQAINRFMVAFGGSRADRGMLVTEKYSPFLVYDKERREPRVRFITRERLQAFVDSFSLR
ncbi:MAG: hypothetical protein QNJ88_05220 [Acidimicrobiia bacterium]|nr:hypothetical protein [Acidimicrobiia bacterium]